MFIEKPLSLFFSPCPNDTFMFEAMVHGRVDTEGLLFDVRLADVEALNHAAMRAEADVTKVSFHAYAYLRDNYELLPSGSALGFGNGPLLVSAKPIGKEQVSSLSVAIPGCYTTAAALLKAAFPEVQDLREYVFSDIEEALLKGETDAGVLIHEGRFTYNKKGLHLIADLGALWEKQTGMPIPLGGIVVRRNLSEDIKGKVARVLRRSVEYALAQPDSSIPFVRQYAQEMDENVMRQHIKLYVNKFSIDLGEEGQRAVDCFLKMISCPCQNVEW
ncbi:MAG: 1,4-dihydroxy-6-naphthoate synthase [Prevotellaceae bacterium]|jgi:1,4-dihydroxy-6-naphthoate synthase|nr:1,4-dihydroxy-6-naphthoate synthase [Prevotellaceae bacterium]